MEKTTADMGGGEAERGVQESIVKMVHWKILSTEEGSARTKRDKR